MRPRAGRAQETRMNPMTQDLPKAKTTALGLYVTAAEAYSMWQADPEGSADPQEDADARVGGALLDVDEHASADAGDGGELVEGPAPGPPQLADPVANRRRKGCGLVIHECMILHFPVHTLQNRSTHMVSLFRSRGSCQRMPTSRVSSLGSSPPQSPTRDAIRG